MTKIIAFQFLSREVLVIAIAVLVLFGGTRLPQIGRLLGRSLKEFRKGLRNAKDEFEEATKDFQADQEDEDMADSDESEESQVSEEAADLKSSAKENCTTVANNDDSKDENRPTS